MEDLSTGSESDYSNSWISWFLSTKGNEYFAEVDEDYILDRFNLTGLNGEVVQEYSRALNLITDNLDEESLDDDVREAVETSARFLYGLIHARYIVTSRGLSKMLEKYRKADFGRCPRVYCYQQPLLPVGLSDIPYQKAVKLYCPRCEDIYSPKSNRHGSIDGAYFGTTFPHMLFMVYPQMIPGKGQPVGSSSVADVNRSILNQQRLNQQDQQQSSSSISGIGGGGGDRGGGERGNNGPSSLGSTTISTSSVATKAERYEPRIFGFKVNEDAKLSRWRTAKRDAQIARLENLEREQGQPNL